MAEKETADSEHSATDERRQKMKLNQQNGWKALSEKFWKKNRSGDAPHKQERPSVGSMEIFKFAQPLDLCLIISSILLCKYICFYKILYSELDASSWQFPEDMGKEGSGDRGERREMI